MAKKRRKFTQCPNCGYTFEEVNNYCPNCGQENHDLNVPVKHLLWEFLEGTLHYDTKFWLTLKYLLFRPGLLTEKFNLGKRAAYVPPIRLYVFISFVFFFLVATNQKLFKIHDKPDVKVQADASQQLQKKVTGASIIGPGMATTTSGNPAVAPVDTVTTKPEVDFGNTETAIFLEQKVEQFLGGGEAVRAKLVKNTSLMMFALMPFFAYLLYLFYYKQRRNYVEHLMFSIHLHAFIFILSSIGILLGFVFPEVNFFGWMVLLVLVYVYFALRQVYKQSHIRTIAKLIPLSTVYITSLVLFFVATVVISALLT